AGRRCGRSRRLRDPELHEAGPVLVAGLRRLVVPDPPRIRLRLRVALRRVLPLLLAAEGGHVQVAPRAPEGLVAPAVDEVGAEHLVAITDERVRPVPLVDTEVDV